MKFILEDNSKIKIISRISSILCSKLDEHADCFMSVKFNMSANLEEYERSVSKTLLKFTFVVVTEPRVAKYHIEGMAEIEGRMGDIKKMLEPYASTNVPMVLYDIFQQVYPSMFTLSKIVDAPCPCLDLLNAHQTLVFDVNNVQKVQVSSTQPEEAPADKVSISS